MQNSDWRPVTTYHKSLFDNSTAEHPCIGDLEIGACPNPQDVRIGGSIFVRKYGQSYDCMTPAEAREYAAEILNAVDLTEARWPPLPRD